MQHFLLTIKTSLRNRHKFYFLLVSLFLIPTFLLADDSGSCGDGLTYTYDSGTRTLTISKTKPGTGEMGFYYQKKRPWEKYKDEIASIIINEGVTTIGVWAFHDLYSLRLFLLKYLTFRSFGFAYLLTSVSTTGVENLFLAQSTGFPSDNFY